MANNSTCKTTIHMGAAHYALDMRVGEVSSRVDLAEVLWGFPPRERNSRLSGIAEIICQAHGITYNNRPATPVAAPRREKKVRKATPPPYVGIFISRREDITMEATL